jgi:YgiT-type zinc finger domain-containing protein
MTCLNCNVGHTTPATATKTLERDETLVVVRHVPIEVCDECGTPVYSGAVVEQLLAVLNEAHLAGVAFQVREFSPAPVRVAS